MSIQIIIRELDESYWYNNIEDIPTCRSISEYTKLIKAYLTGLTSIKANQFDNIPLPDYIGINPDDLPYD